MSNISIYQAGDRQPRINLVYPQDVFYHHGKGGRVLDVTKPPFNAKGDGVTDDTKALESAMRFVRDFNTPSEDERFVSCGFRLNHSWMIYLPDGEYLVSNTVSQGWPAMAFNTPTNSWDHVNRFTVASPQDDRGFPHIRNEENYKIHIVGQSREKTIIRLKDFCPGFVAGMEKAVIAFYLLQRGSNTNLGNYLKNVTIHTGKGNPGAIGLKWNASNFGGVQNVAILSGDGYGRAGLMMDRRNAHGYHHDLVVDGFDVGIELAAGVCTIVVLEYATLSNQRKMAICVGPVGQPESVKPYFDILERDALSARKILIKGSPNALKIGRAGHVLLFESELNSSNVKSTAIEVEKDGHLFVRDINLSGYQNAIVRNNEVIVKENYIKEYVSDQPVSLHADTSAETLRLPVRDVPVILPEKDLSKWANVDDYGAVGDGIHDDTEAIQRAMDSGKPVVYFPKANYVINGTVNIPAEVREVSFLWSSIHRSETNVPDGPALFRISHPSGDPLLIHENINAGGFFIDHEADRTLILTDVISWFNHVRHWAAGQDMLFPGPAAQNTVPWQLYRNTKPKGFPKEVFACNVLGFAAGSEGVRHVVENVHAWIRQLNNEHYPWAQIAFSQSDAWIFGFKSEFGRVLLQATDNTRLEVYGGLYFLRNRVDMHVWYSIHKGAPLITSRDSLVSLSFFTWQDAGGSHPPYITILHDETKGRVKRLPYVQFTLLGGRENEILIPLLVNAKG